MPTELDALHEAVVRDLTEAHPLDPELVRSVAERGFAAVPGVLQRDTVSHFAPVVADVAAGSVLATVPMAERGTYQKAFLQETNLWQRVGAMRPFTFSEKLGRLAAELLGVDGVRLYHDQALVKEPHGGHTPWHCDQYYWPIDSDRTITAWVPLVDVPLEMGPIRFSAGSHTIDLGRDVPIGDESDAVIRRHPRWRELPVHEHPVAAGDVTFHTGWTFHGAGPNATDATRLVFTVIYVADGARLAEPRTDGQRLDRKVWLPDSEVGRPIDSWLNPVVWRRDGAHRATLGALPPVANRIGTFDLGPRT